MIAKFRQSWELCKTSVSVTMRHRKLLVFPLLTTLFTLVIALFFLTPLAVPLVTYPSGYKITQAEHWKAVKQHYLPNTASPGRAAEHADTAAKHALGVLLAHGNNWDGTRTSNQANIPPWVSAYFVGLYFLSMFLATFFNVAFYNEIIAALNGKEVSFRRGLAVAWSRLPSILAWSMLAGVVGWLIRRLEQRLPFFGRIIASLVGLGWSIAAVFVIPVIIQEQPMRNPLKILKQSAFTLKRTWGEGLIGYIGFSAGNLVIFLCSLVPLLLAAVFAYALKSGWILAIAVPFWLLGLLCAGYIMAIAGHVYRCALYIFAAEGVVPDLYTAELMDRAWKIKGGPSHSNI